MRPPLAEAPKVRHICGEIQISRGGRWVDIEVQAIPLPLPPPRHPPQPKNENCLNKNLIIHVGISMAFLFVGLEFGTV